MTAVESNESGNGKNCVMKKPKPGEIQKILDDYQPERTPVSELLAPWRELIEGLQRRRASLRVIVQILKNRDVLCSESSLFRYLRDAGIQPKKTSQHRAKSRRRGEDSAQPARPDHPGDGTTLAEQPGVAHSVSEGEASTAPAENGEPSANRSQSTAMPLPPRPADATRDRVRKRGPRIAQIKLLDDSES